MGSSNADGCPVAGWLAWLRGWGARPEHPGCGLASDPTQNHSHFVLASAEDKRNHQVAAELSVNQVTIGKWRQRFGDKRLKGLADERRPGVPRTVTDDHVEAVVVKTLTEKPADATHWSTISLAKATGMSQPTIARIWKAFGLKPWLGGHFQAVRGPVVHRQGPRRRRAVPEPTRTRRRALRGREDPSASPRSHPAHLPDASRCAAAPQPRLRPPRHDRLYAALDLASGAVLHQLTKRHRAIEFKKFLDHRQERSAGAGHPRRRG